MFISQLLNNFRNRVSWSTMKALLKMCNLPISCGWESTIHNLEKITKENQDKFLERQNKLYEYYCNSLLVSEKSVKFFNFHRSTIDQILTRLPEQKIEENVFHETYPFSLNEEKLKDIDSLPDIQKTYDVQAIKQDYFGNLFPLNPGGIIPL